ncbi:Hypothetical_protein [Hexamita inflata]|uniref:Hypothetical_protein n=1 Tax=Hexamita inflata TaxID=28002 RepID=A0ABP1J681_9EUKA
MTLRYLLVEVRLMVLDGPSYLFRQQLGPSNSFRLKMLFHSEVSLGVPDMPISKNCYLLSLMKDMSALYLWSVLLLLFLLTSLTSLNLPAVSSSDHISGHIILKSQQLFYIMQPIQKATRIRHLKLKEWQVLQTSVVRKMVTSKYKSTLTALCNQIVSMAYQNHTIRLFYADTICQNVFSGLSISICGLILILMTVRLLITDIKEIIDYIQQQEVAMFGI